MFFKRISQFFSSFNSWQILAELSTKRICTTTTSINVEGPVLSCWIYKQRTMATCSFDKSVNESDLKRYQHYWTWPEQIPNFDWSKPWTRDEFAVKLDEPMSKMETPLKRSHENINNSKAHAYDFSVMQWNILAQGLCLGKDNFIRCQNNKLEWNRRRLYILQEILQVDSDIICLQEVDHFGLIYPALRSIGYEGFFFPKPDSPALYVEKSDGPDGCAMFYKTAKLKLKKHENIVLKTMHDVCSNQVAIIMHFSIVGTEKEMVVATTHLKAKSGWDKIRYEQGKYLIEYLKQHYGQHAIVLCGDFNADANEKVYTAIKNSDLELCSAYCLLSGDKVSEPPYTTWKIRGSAHTSSGEVEVCRTIDYIWYSKPLLKVHSLLQLPDEAEIGKDRLPSAQYPSDHLSMAARFVLL